MEGRYRGEGGRWEGEGKMGWSKGFISDSPCFSLTKLHFKSHILPLSKRNNEPILHFNDPLLKKEIKPWIWSFLAQDPGRAKRCKSTFMSWEKKMEIFCPLEQSSHMLLLILVYPRGATRVHMQKEKRNFWKSLFSFI